MKHESSEAPPSLPDTSRWVTSEELRSHRSPSDAWVSIRGQVYDVTSYLQFHPGGAKILLASCGRDATAVFDKHHRWIDASYLLRSKKVGRLQASKE
jgi:cytochrome b involved in lipid metabolism